MSGPLDRDIVRATQAGLPLVLRPWAAVAAQVGASEEEVMRRVRAMLADGRIRRIGVVPNHYALGIRANGMSVWDVDDAAIAALGPQVGALDFVTHCYRRPRRPPEWRYNLFAMVHAHTRGEVEAKVARIAAVLGDACRAHEVLYSVRILKKTGLRLA
ncbi:MAG: AsnC family transcriptional regulator [Proteobacteria bacterium]|nr:AsnC family transcriptional regulator [Pseudomonadota bacterium]